MNTVPNFRIAYLCSSQSWGGLEMNQLRNALWMQKRGHIVFILGIADSKSEEFCRQHALSFISIQQHRKYYDFSKGLALNNVLKSLEIEHLIVRDVKEMSVSAIAKFWGKYSFKLHYFMEMQLGVRKTNVLHTLRFWQLDTWSCPLKWLENQVQTMTRMPKNGIVVIPSGIELATFNVSYSISEARKQIGVLNEGLMIGLAGRFDPQKGQHLAIEALNNCLDKSLKLILIGAPTHNEGNEYTILLQKLIQDYNLQSRVFMLPFSDSLVSFYTAIDVLIMATKAETVGMVTLEAMACGTPVIGSNAGGTPEILNQGESGYLFEPQSIESLTEQLNLFCDNPKRFSTQQLQEAVAHFDHEKVCGLVENRLMKHC